MSPVRHTVPILTCAAFVYKVPTCQSVPRFKEYEKQKFYAYLNSANDNFNDIIKLSHFLVQNMFSRYKLTNVPGQTHSPHFDVLCCFCV